MMKLFLDSVNILDMDSIRDRVLYDLLILKTDLSLPDCFFVGDDKEAIERRIEEVNFFLNNLNYKYEVYDNEQS